jgi:hypothetical protein
MHQRTDIRRAFVAAISVIALTFATVGLGALPANAVDDTPVSTSSISGTVTDAATGAPLAGASVVILDATGAQSGSTLTGDTGGYTVSALAAGSYRVSVSLSPSHSPVFWPAATDPSGAESVELGVGEARTGLDVALAAVPPAPPAEPAETVPTDDAEPTEAVESSADDEPTEEADSTDGADSTPEVETAAKQSEPVDSAGSDLESEATQAAAREPSGQMILAAEATSYTVSGRVTDAGGVGIAGASVSISGPLYTSTTTAADGTYALSGLTGGNYYFSAYADGYVSHSDQFDVTADANVDVQLAAGATISGAVERTDGTPVDGPVWIVDPATGGYVASGYAFGGLYEADQLPAGTYAVFIDPTDGALASQFYNGATRLADATLVTVAAGQVVAGIDFTLTVGRTISGVVSPASVASGYLTVSAIPVGGEALSIVRGAVNPDGTYALRGLNPASYLVEVTGASTAGSRYQGFYEGTPDAADATPVSVIDSDKTGIDIELFEGVRIAGTVSSSQEPPPLQKTQITAYLWNGGSWDVAASISGWGNYVFGAVSGWSNYLAPGTYTVGFSDPGAPFGVEPADWVYPYCDQFFDLQPTLGEAQSFDLTGAGAVQSGVDGLLTTTCEQPDVIAGDVTISGTPQVGQTLVAQPGTWSPGPIELAYQWLADGEPIDGADTDTFVVTPDLLGASVEVKVTGTRPGYDSATAGSAPVTIVAGTLAPTTPTITGSTVAGSTLTAVVAPWGPAPVALSYQWNVDGAPLTGATGPTFVLGESEVGELITVTVTGTKPGYATASRTSTGVGPITSVPLEDLSPGTPSISGDPRVGETLTASPGTWGPAPVTLAYQWYADDEAIAGATGQTYVVQADDLGAQLKVVVRGTKPGYNPATASALAPEMVEAGVITPGTPTVSGTPRVGETLTAEPGTWGPDGVALEYEWFADGTLIEGADGPALVLGADQLDALITVRVTGSKDGYTPESATSEQVGPVAAGILTTAKPTITGSPWVGVPLTAAPGAWGPAPVDFSYEWFVGGERVEGATGPSFVPRTGDVGKSVQVAVTGTKPGYETETVVSDASAAVLASIEASNSAPQPGEALTVTGEGFGPGEPVLLELRSDPVVLGTVTADETGSFAYDVTIPADTPVGVHTIIAIGQETGRTASAGITVVMPQTQPTTPPGSGTGSGTGSGSGSVSGSLPGTGTTLPLGTIGAGALLILLGLGVYSVRRRHTETSDR